jgi:peptide/nickel transport system substrate-binding protein
MVHRTPFSRLITDRLRDLVGINDRADLWNVALDEHAAGHIDRRNLLKYAGLLGIGSAIVSAGILPLATPARAATGGTIRVGTAQPVAAFNPVLLTDSSSIAVLSQVGEYLILDEPELGLQPQLALSWEPDESLSRWTVHLRPNVKFHDGRELTSADVVATFERLADPQNGSTALSAFKGLLSKGGTRALDPLTVLFETDEPNANFPYYISSSVVAAIILPADYSGDYEKTFIGTGPFRFESYEPRRAIRFVRNNEYWGDKALLDRVEIRFYDNEQAQFVALKSGEVDVIPEINSLTSAVEGDSKFRVLSVDSSRHDQLHLRTDSKEFSDARVRRAFALAIDREAIVSGLFKGRAVAGNDSIFAPVYASTDTSVPQRRQDLPQAKRLLAEAGVPNGFKVSLTTERAYSIPNYAVLLQNQLKQVGIELDLNIIPQDAYYGKAVFGESPWLDSTIGITDFGHRGTPDLILNSTLRSDGPWNAAHFNNTKYDALLRDYARARDVQSQRQAAGSIQTLLLEETPTVIAYFNKFIRFSNRRVDGVRFTAISHLLLGRAYVV